MSKTYTVLEKITGIVFTLHGIYVTTSIILGYYRYQEQIAEWIHDNPELDYQVQSLVSYLLSIRSVVICQVCAITGGLLLVMNKKAGWVLSGASAITQFFYSLFAFWLVWKGPGAQVLWFAVAVVVFAASLFVIFSSELIRKYQPGKRMWTWVFGLAIIFAVDYILLMIHLPF